MATTQRRIPKAKYRTIKVIAPSAAVLDPRPDGLYLPAAVSCTWKNEDDSDVAAVSLIAGYHDFSPKVLSVGAGVYGCYR